MKKMLRIIFTMLIVFQCNLLVASAAVGQPKIKKVKQTGQKEVTVTWSKVSGATGYTLEYKCAGGKWTEKRTSKRELVLVKLKQNKIYRIRVRAYKDSKKKGISAVYKYGKYSLEKKIRVSKLAKTNSFNPSLTGFFVIESKYNANGTVALDINDNNMGNRGNLETYPKHSGPNQVFLVSSVGNGYYTLSPVHSRKYIHRADGSSVNIYQWDGSTNWNAHWQIISAGSGYYYLRNRASGKYMTRDLDRSRSSNNVYEASRPIGYSLKTQKWKFISVGRPGYSLNTSMENGPASTYSREDTFTTRYTLNSNYPITRWELNVYTSTGVHKLSGANTPNYPTSSETWSIPMKLLSAGNYYIQLVAWNAWGDGLRSPKYYFSVKDNNASTGNTSKSVTDALRWCDRLLNTKVGSGQCVALIQAYYKYLGVSPVSGHAYQYATNSLPSGWRRVKGGTPQPGDILIYAGATYGHVAIYAGGTTAYHQNMSGKYVEKKTNWNYNKNWYSKAEQGTKYYWGYIRPKFN